MPSILIVGAGMQGAAHAQAYQAMDDVNVAGIVDIREEQAKPLAGDDVSIFTSFDEIGDIRDHIDIIDICLPTHLHKAYVCQAADMQCDVICEQPLARYGQDAEAMIRYCERQNVRLFPAQGLRFEPVYQKAKQSLDRGVIGSPGVVRMTHIAPFPSGWQDWYADFQSSGGLILDMLIADFDFLRWCFGDIERVYAKGLLGREMARRDYDLVTLRFQNGTIAHIEGSWGQEARQTAFEMAGDQGIITHDSHKETPLQMTPRQWDDSEMVSARTENPFIESPCFRQLQHMIECYQSGQEPLASQHEAKKAIEVSLAVLASIKTVKPVTFT